MNLSASTELCLLPLQESHRRLCEDGRARGHDRFVNVEVRVVMRTGAVALRQQLFSLPVCEVGYAGRLSLGWKRRANGNDYWLPEGSEESECVVTLNEGDSLRLSPPGLGAQARLRIDFNIDDQRYLCATIHDLHRDKDIRTAERVIKLR